MAGERSDNGERMVSFCALNNHAIASTSTNGQHHSQIDHEYGCSLKF